jgi:peptidyl-prolyl cis-trans isomerase A (cyclophilin A)
MPLLLWLPLLLQAETLKDPQRPEFNLTAPAEFRVRLETSEGDVVLKTVRADAPRGADRFYSLVKAGYYDGARFYRVLKGFIAQTGIHGDPAVAAAWKAAPIEDDPRKRRNLRGTLAFAMGGPGTRTTNLFVNLKDSPSLDRLGFAPFAEVTEGMDVVERLYAGYGDGAPKGKGPAQAKIYERGNAWLEKEFPELDYIKTARIVDP